jgi:hypothetical protein
MSDSYKNLDWPTDRRSQNNSNLNLVSEVLIQPREYNEELLKEKVVAVV